MAFLPGEDAGRPVSKPQQSKSAIRIATNSFDAQEENLVQLKRKAERNRRLIMSTIAVRQLRRASAQTLPRPTAGLQPRAVRALPTVSSTKPVQSGDALLLDNYYSKEIETYRSTTSKTSSLDRLRSLPSVLVDYYERETEAYQSNAVYLRSAYQEPEGGAAEVASGPPRAGEVFEECQSLL